MRNPLKFAAASAALGLVLAGGTTLLAAQMESRFTYKQDITVAADEVLDHVVAFGGNVTVEGAVKKAVFVIGGTITISGEVGEVVGIGTRPLKSTGVTGTSSSRRRPDRPGARWWRHALFQSSSQQLVEARPAGDAVLTFLPIF
jgi:hypothetical protein